MTLSARDALIAATLCPGLSGEAWVRAMAHAPLQPALFPTEPDWAEVSPAGARATSIAAWRAFLAGPAAEVVARALEAVASVDGVALTPLDSGWPAELPPKGVLWVQGALDERPRVALVGARRADRYGRDIVRRAARAAAERGVTVVSGGALGTDAAAHEACLEAGGRTVVVLGSGLLRPAPTTHAGLFERARSSGAVISPFPPDLPPSRFSFPKRNAWIAGLSAVTVVFQAAADSGALHTARAASELDRPVYALPGPIDSPLHGGAHALIQAGAKVLLRPDAFLEEPSLTADGVDKLRTASTMATRVSVLTQAGPPFGQALWRVAGAEPVPLASLAEEAGMSASEAASLAVQLELAGWLRAASGGRFARATP